jgi:hypothetical protein
LRYCDICGVPVVLLNVFLFLLFVDKLGTSNASDLFFKMACWCANCASNISV